MRHLLTLVLFAGLSGLLVGCGDEAGAPKPATGTTGADAMKKMEEQMKGMKPSGEQIKAMQEKGGKTDEGAKGDEGKGDEEKGDEDGDKEETKE